MHQTPEDGAGVGVVHRHGSGCLAGYAARKNLATSTRRSAQFQNDARAYWAARDFDERYRVERIGLGFNDTAERKQPMSAAP
jgi:hypothetical protein